MTAPTMSPFAMTEDKAHRIYNLLEKFGSASSSGRREFVRYAVENTDHGEYRFIGNLGFGGKFYTTRDSWYVGCYNEDQSEFRQQVMMVLNYLIEQVRTSAR